MEEYDDLEPAMVRDVCNFGAFLGDVLVNDGTPPGSMWDLSPINPRYLGNGGFLFQITPVKCLIGGKAATFYKLQTLPTSLKKVK